MNQKVTLEPTLTYQNKIIKVYTCISFGMINAFKQINTLFIEPTLTYLLNIYMTDNKSGSNNKFTKK